MQLLCSVFLCVFRTLTVPCSVVFWGYPACGPQNGEASRSHLACGRPTEAVIWVGYQAVGATNLIGAIFGGHG